MRYGARTDANHAEIRNGLRKCGFTVEDYHKLGRGVPDLCVLIRPGYSLLLEVKMPGEKLTEAEEKWVKFHASITRTVFSLEEAIRVINEYKARLSCMLKNLD
jgi:hypothetical protein